MYESTYHWILNENESSITDELIERYKLSELSQHILENRGFTSEDDLKKILEPETHSPSLIYDIDKATELIQEHVNNQSRILIYGDYDADGITSTTILYKALKKRNINVYFFIPNRVDHGYGLNYDLLQEEVIGNFDLVITVDNGVTHIKEIELLRENDIDVIVIDHHEFSEEMPNAVIIHPNHPNGNYPCNNLAGVGITYKVIEALGYVEDEFIGLVAIGTIADMVPMFDENRYFVIHGLDYLNSHTNIGVKALLNAAKSSGEITEETVGFTIAPRLNATGRIDEASISVSLLLSESYSEAEMIATEIEMLNDTRKQMVEDTYAEAVEFLNADDNIHVIYGDLWHPGVLGIVASKIVEAYGVPAILLTKDEDVYTGSARSINTIELLQELSHLKVSHVAHGHNQAFGIKVPIESMDDFKDELTAYMNDKGSSSKPTRDVDLKLTNKNVTTDDIKALNALRPFGHGFLAPTVMISGARIDSIRQLGVDNKHLKMTLYDYSFEVIGFNYGELYNETSQGEKIYMIGTLGINEFNGVEKVQLVLNDAEIKDMQLFDMRSKNNQNFKRINKKSDIFFIAEDKEKLGDNYFHYGETIIYNVDQVIFRDLPISIQNFEASVKQLKTSKLVAIFDDKDNLFFSGIPKVQTIEHVYETIINAENGAIDLKKYAPQFAKKHNITMDMLVKVLNVLDDLNRVKLNEGVIFYNEDLTSDLVVIESKYFKQLSEKLNAETILKMSSRPELKTYIETLINE
ncbi:hypothetical protein HMPREF2767_08285 [Nosocomiicoccus sp. HMSC067E10]|uniref:single-stranded-DNA-specific exonuclease RecJ n=1 Tax=Nosocomiicoccus TaxID=489909 RepID=UPI0008335A04|nr:MULTISPECIES: single-stranded-DNA-specific exonuclease RecJ [Nosocomiicoccus]OFL48143.1 hypothetical protein HMPREF2767_08285 [Nosocomiicoccus sp. HMSC067E10]